MIYLFIHLIYKQLNLYINLCIKKQHVLLLRTTRFTITQWRFIFNLYFSNRVEFDLKSIISVFTLRRINHRTCINYDVTLLFTNVKTVKPLSRIRFADLLAKMITWNNLGLSKLFSWLILDGSWQTKRNNARRWTNDEKALFAEVLVDDDSNNFPAGIYLLKILVFLLLNLNM